MNKGLVYLEKILAAIQVLIAGSLMYGLCQSIMDDAAFMVSEQGFAGEHSSVQFHWNFVAYQQVYLFILLCLLGGILWLFNLKAGWIISYAFWITYLLFLVLLLSGSHSRDWLVLLSFLIEILIALPFVIFLGSKPALKKYGISKINWVIMASITALSSLDLYWHRLF